MVVFLFCIGDFSHFFCTFDVKEILKFNRLETFFAMNNTDWKDALGKAFGVNVPDGDAQAQQETDQTAEKGDALAQQGKTRLDIILERKGRAGKQATIVTGFTVDDEALKQVASRLKRSLGVGGSARGGEILVQGDWRQRVLDELTAMGFKARII